MIVPGARSHNFDSSHLNWPLPPTPPDVSLMQRAYTAGRNSLHFFRRQSVSEKMEGELLVRWQDLTTFLTDSNRVKWWNNLMDAYRPRPFRGLDHLHQMLAFFDRYKDCLKDRYATAFVVFFKNIVYDPQSEDSATKSAQMLRQFAQETTFDSENYVADLIVASGSATTDAHLSEGATGSDDLHYVIDFDMAFLADPAKKFSEHELAQRKEYPNLSDEEYAKQRLKVLKLFLQIPNIYATKEMREELEQRARANIQHEIQLLEKGERKY